MLRDGSDSDRNNLVGSMINTLKFNLGTMIQTAIKDGCAESAFEPDCFRKESIIENCLTGLNEHFESWNEQLDLLNTPERYEIVDQIVSDHELKMDRLIRRAIQNLAGKTFPDSEDSEPDNGMDARTVTVQLLSDAKACLGEIRSQINRKLDVQDFIKAAEDMCDSTWKKIPLNDDERLKKFIREAVRDLMETEAGHRRRKRDDLIESMQARIEHGASQVPNVNDGDVLVDQNLLTTVEWIMSQLKPILESRILEFIMAKPGEPYNNLTTLMEDIDEKIQAVTDQVTAILVPGKIDHRTKSEVLLDRLHMRMDKVDRTMAEQKSVLQIVAQKFTNDQILERLKIVAGGTIRTNYLLNNLVIHSSGMNKKKFREFMEEVRDMEMGFIERSGIFGDKKSDIKFRKKADGLHKNSPTNRRNNSDDDRNYFNDPYV